MWLLFSITSQCGKPTTITANFTKNMNIKWVNLFMAILPGDLRK